MSNIGFIGAGNMATALIGGIIEKKILPARNVVAFDVVPDKIKHTVFQLMFGHLSVGKGNSRLRDKFTQEIGDAGDIVDAVVHKIHLTLAG